MVVFNLKLQITWALRRRRKQSTRSSSDKTRTRLCFVSFSDLILFELAGWPHQPVRSCTAIVFPNRESSWWPNSPSLKNRVTLERNRSHRVREHCLLHLQTDRFGWALLTNGKSLPRRFLNACLLCHKSHDVGVFDNAQNSTFYK